MSVITVTRFTVAPENVEELRSRHAALVADVKDTGAGLARAQFGRIDETSYVGIWRWDSAADLQAAREIPPAPEAAKAAFSLVTDATVDEIHVLDEL
ncbi:antibiotic biosynthesis monooxygenase [Glycomyces buryatensis]|uniref:ABM domain-containing protein n=1 Tax=Glycomyces buryatensis TaxID=2570927 RepID=A0A4S8Q9I5_9ACTN|nr:antibiotic biosynthesis monooxygenase [Glycomyces buryatensis]THV41097.1 hypothetical protein FAB82_13425 [Glycomyces buryatensis]